VQKRFLDACAFLDGLYMLYLTSLSSLKGGSLPLVRYDMSMGLVKDFPEGPDGAVLFGVLCST